MGKKTDDLKLKLAARDALIKGIADALELDITEDIDMGNVARYATMFMTSLGRHPALTATRGGEIGDTHLLVPRPFEQLVDQETAHIEALNIRSALESLAEELDLETKKTLGTLGVVTAITEAIGRLKNPAAAADPATASIVPTNDSLAQAIAHERRQRVEFEEALVRARAVINRIAGGLQIDRWDADGTELVERAQRWNTFKVTLTAVANQWRARPATEQVSAATVAQQFQALVTTVVSTREFARWFQNAPRTLVVSPELHEAATNPPAMPEGEKFTAGDVIRLHRCVSDHATDQSDGRPGPLLEFLERTFKGIASSVVATREFCDLMNLVILPILARQAAVGTTPKN